MTFDSWAPVVPLLFLTLHLFIFPFALVGPAVTIKNLDWENWER